MEASLTSDVFVACLFQHSWRSWLGLVREFAGNREGGAGRGGGKGGEGRGGFRLLGHPGGGVGVTRKAG